MIGNVLVIDDNGNKPFAEYPRNVALRAEEYLRETKIAGRMLAQAPEFEFYILDQVATSAVPIRFLLTGHAAGGSGTTGLATTIIPVIMCP